MTKWLKSLLTGLVLVLLLSAVALAEPVQLQFWTPFTGPDGAYMERMVDKFNEEHAGEIEVELFILAGGADYITKLALAIRTGAPPGVVILSPNDYFRFLDSLTSWTREELIDQYGLDVDDFSSNILDAVTRDGKIYAIPLGTYCLGLYYNIDHLVEAGLEPRAPRDMTEFLEYARKLTVDKDGDGSIDQWGWYSFGGWPFRVLWQWYTLLFQNGGSLLSEDQRSAEFYSPEGMSALEFYVDLIHKEGVAPPDPADPEEAFRVGMLSLHVNGPWMINLFKEQPGLNWAVAPVPVLGEKQVVWGDAHLMCIPKQSPETTEAAITLAKWLSDNSLEWAKAGQVPVRNSIVESEEFAALTEQYEFAKQLPYVQFLPQTERLAEIESVLLEYMDAAYLGDMDPEEALEYAAEEVDDILRRR
ncbi:MAG: ABC transporter substrate-binding protein [Firmicutes bacterium]|nr:ABC transporter substrate-binding protein [Bacillota bacterium]